ncbi:MAG: [protein-PII] uridylyltransferase [Deltaproteobacteria bacterium]|nr:[protein-PII] uridylyltransferase [Deltaproteobacteria bacterium]
MFHAKFLEPLNDISRNAGARPIIPAVKEYLSRCSDELRKRHLAGQSGADICAAYTLVIDDLLRSLFREKTEVADWRDMTSLVAMGGYGRRELNMRSDIDLMLLYRNKLTPAAADLTQRILYILWDTGLDLGFSVRSVDECMTLAKNDLKTLTALLDRRLILGDNSLFEQLGVGIKKKLLTGRGVGLFIKSKIEESRSRHEKFGGSVYILEPNVKEGEGGLRDFHTAMWIIKAKGECGGDPVASGLITGEDMASVRGSLDFLLWVRNEMHFSSGRKTDQLSFDHQERSAGLRGFKNSPHALAVESFMQQYYRHASNINHFSDLMISRALHKDRGRVSLWPKKKVRVDRMFGLEGKALIVKDTDAFLADPASAMKAFEYSEAFGVLLDQAAKDLIISLVGKSAEELRLSREASESFMKILKGKNVFKTLSDMQEIRFLEGYMPEFAEISCRVQHDLYHVYTVDAHTLFAVRELERLRGPYKFDFHVLSTLFEDLSNPEILMLAVLFHDIGKAHGKGHAEKGAEMAAGICKRLNLSEDDTDIIRFLVKHHLLLADTAQYRDIHDERLVIEFARKVGDIERLSLLYLLTFADVRAVGPEVWSQWKGALFQELFFKARTVLERGSFEVEEAESKIARIREKVALLLKPEGIGGSEVDDFFGLLPHRYFLSTGPEDVAAHIMILRGLTGSKPCLMHVRQVKLREYTELIICTHDVHGLFAMITGVMAGNGVNILGAQINTLKNGLVLDILQVTSPAGDVIKKDRRGFNGCHHGAGKGRHPRQEA